MLHFKQKFDLYQIILRFWESLKIDIFNFLIDSWDFALIDKYRYFYDHLLLLNVTMPGSWCLW